MQPRKGLSAPGALVVPEVKPVNGQIKLIINYNYNSYFIN